MTFPADETFEVKENEKDASESRAVYREQPCLMCVKISEHDGSTGGNSTTKFTSQYCVSRPSLIAAFICFLQTLETKPRLLYANGVLPSDALVTYGYAIARSVAQPNSDPTLTITTSSTRIIYNPANRRTSGRRVFRS